MACRSGFSATTAPLLNRFIYVCIVLSYMALSEVEVAPLIRYSLSLFLKIAFKLKNKKVFFLTSYTLK